MNKQEKVKISVRVPAHLVEDVALKGYKNVTDLVVDALEIREEAAHTRINRKGKVVLDFNPVGRNNWLNKFMDSEGRAENNLEHGAPIVGEEGVEMEETTDENGNYKLHLTQEVRPTFMSPLLAAPYGQKRHGGETHLKACAAFINERRRQVEEEGHTLKKDKRYINGQLPRAAAAYVMYGYGNGHAGVGVDPLSLWPWNEESFKPNPPQTGADLYTSRKRQLEKAGALLLAEWERIDKLQNKKP